MDLPVCYTPLWVSPSDKPVDDRLVNSCQVLRYQYIYYMPLWAHMQVMPVYVLVLINNKGLIGVAHLFDILPCDGRELLVAETVIGMRIQGDVYNRFFSEDMTWHICHKVLHTGGYIVCSISRREHFVGLQNLRDTFVYLLSVVC